MMDAWGNCGHASGDLRIQFPGPWDTLFDFHDMLMWVKDDVPEDKWRRLYEKYQEFDREIQYYIVMAESGT